MTTMLLILLGFTSVLSTVLGALLLRRRVSEAKIRACGAPPIPMLFCDDCGGRTYPVIGSTAWACEKCGKRFQCTDSLEKVLFPSPLPATNRESADLLAMADKVAAELLAKVRPGSEWRLGGIERRLGWRDSTTRDGSVAEAVVIVPLGGGNIYSINLPDGVPFWMVARAMDAKLVEVSLDAETTRRAAMASSWVSGLMDEVNDSVRKTDACIRDVKCRDGRCTVTLCDGGTMVRDMPTPSDCPPEEILGALQRTWLRKDHSRMTFHDRVALLLKQELSGKTGA